MPAGKDISLLRSPIPLGVEHLICPACGGGLTLGNDSLTCSDCQQVYGLAETGAWDLRPKSAPPRTLSFDVIEGADRPFRADGKPLSLHPSPAVDAKGLPWPHHMTPEMISHLPAASQAGAPMLDLGCGKMRLRPIMERAAYKYVGIDYYSPQAEIFADAHALPFVRETFELIISLQVLEHIRLPHLYASEAYRVTKPGGMFMGSVAFMEPWHGHSYFHTSPEGVHSLLTYAGYDVSHIGAYPKKEASAMIAKFWWPHLPRAVSRGMMRPFEWAQETFHWTVDRMRHRRGGELRRLGMAGSVVWIARRPG